MLKIHFPETLILIRHGQTPWNKEKRMQGSVDIPLNETGRAQAREYGRVLKQLIAAEIVDPKTICVRVSPRQRARETARIACQEAEIKREFQIEPRIVEQYYGLWEGKLFSEIETQWPDLWAMRLKAPLSYRPPEGESGEEEKARVAKVIDECQGATLLVGHFGTVRSLVALCHDNGIKTTLELATLTGSQDIVYVVQNGELTEYRPD